MTDKKDIKYLLTLRKTSSECFIDLVRLNTGYGDIVYRQFPLYYHTPEYCDKKINDTLTFIKDIMGMP